MKLTCGWMEAIEDDISHYNEWKKKTKAVLFGELAIIKLIYNSTCIILGFLCCSTVTTIVTFKIFNVFRKIDLKKVAGVYHGC